MGTKCDYLVAFIFSGLVGIGGKLILSASGQDKNMETFQKIPIATGLSGIIILGTTDILKMCLICQESQAPEDPGVK